MVKSDRAYSDWQAREQRKRTREEYQADRMLEMDSNLAMAMWNKEPEPRREFSRNETSRRAGKSAPAPEVVRQLETVQMRNGASFTFTIFDEASKLSPSEALDRKPVFDPLTIYAQVERNNGGRALTGSQKRKVFAAEKVRYEQRVKEWEERMTAQELEALEVEISRSTLGFGGW